MFGESLDFKMSEKVVIQKFDGGIKGVENPQPLETITIEDGKLISHEIHIQPNGS